ncbi:histidine kinase [Actibacterium pelagium]|uniref:Histidine kinase n=2 Tax=Actibacterium pelagium TaxID=2029103 RepID=A0A917ANB8_9RHOB|nr:histidine kinase [Actibacterium pelagium]
MIVAMVLVGGWVSSRIEQAVVQNTANDTAIFMESFVSPISQDLSQSDVLPIQAQRALAEVFETVPLKGRIVSYKLWKRGGLVAHASDPDIIGKTFPVTEDLRSAWLGSVAATFEDLDHIESESEAALGVPLLEIYTPIREAWSGEVIAVAEFYEAAEELSAEMTNARRNSWLVVSATFLGSGLMLFGIVAAGGRTIRRQKAMLLDQLLETQAVSEQNLRLRNRVVEASSRSTAQSDRFLRQLGAELHDGPAQYLSLAALRLDSALGGTKAAGEVDDIRQSLANALTEIRSISRGLAIPDLDRLSLRKLIDRAVQDGATAFASPPVLTFEGDEAPQIDYSAKLCLFRFLQEALSNAARHAPGAGVTIWGRACEKAVCLKVRDEGPGFDPEEAMQIRPDGGQGLLGLVDRAESLGGQVEIQSKPGAGCELILTLPLQSRDL